MERQYEVFPTRGHALDSTKRLGLGGALSIMLFKFHLWLNGGASLWGRKTVKGDDDDEHTCRNIHVKKAWEGTTDSGEEEARRKQGVGGSRELNVPRTAAPRTPQRTPPPLTPASAAAAVVGAIEAKNSQLQPDWKTAWAEWVAQRKERDDREENTKAEVVTYPSNSRSPTDILASFQRENSGREEESLVTPPMTPLCSRSSSEHGGVWSSPSPHEHGALWDESGF